MKGTRLVKPVKSQDELFKINNQRAYAKQSDHLQKNNTKVLIGPDTLKNTVFHTNFAGF